VEAVAREQRDQRLRRRKKERHARQNVFFRRRREQNSGHRIGIVRDRERGDQFWSQGRFGLENEFQRRERRGGDLKLGF